jgi:serine protease Do
VTMPGGTSGRCRNFKRAFAPLRLLLGTVIAVGLASHVDLSASIAAREQPPGASPPGSFAPIVAKVRPAVVAVEVKRPPPAPAKRARARQVGRANRSLAADKSRPIAVTGGVGSGFFVSPDGYVVTNNHVVQDAIAVQIRTSTGSTYAARIVGADPGTDLALLKVDADESFSYVDFADHLPSVGDWVLTVGSPFGFYNTVTAGIVSGRNRNIDAGAYDQYLQIDAPINRGSSGGPAFDMEGRVIGINTALYSPSGGSVGVGFDIPATSAKFVIGELRAKGRVARGWVGVHVHTVTRRIADTLGLKGADGVLVDAPRPGSPAAKVGILPGDIIVAVDGQPIRNRPDFGRAMSIKAPGDPVALRVLRHGHTRTVKLTLGEMPPEIRVQTRADVDDVLDASPSRSDRAQARAPGHEMKPQ